MKHPYMSLPACSFWKSSVASLKPAKINGLWDPKFQILPDDRVSTYGSCFAQHIGNALIKRGYTWFRSEPAPFGMTKENKKKFGYNLFSSRTTNIYTPSLLNQWAGWAMDPDHTPDEVWQKNGRFFDPFRPRVEPDGFASLAEMRSARDTTIRAFHKSISKARFFVFTLGLTERWVNSAEYYEYSICPGTAAGSFDPAIHRFDNMDYASVSESLKSALTRLRRINPEIKIILTVSPVPLIATASDAHVLVATMHSKSILRAVAGQFALEYDDVDYFPSYEIINSPVFKGRFFESDQRSVTSKGVEFVMSSFFARQNDKFGKPSGKKSRKKPNDPSVRDDDGTVCDEEILGAFG